MCARDVYDDVDSNTVGDEGVERCAVRRGDRFGRGATLGRACECRCISGGPRPGPSVGQLPELRQQDDRAARDEQDHGVEGQELSIIRTSAHFSTSERRNKMGEEATPGPPADQSSVDSTGATAATDWP
jgi:hypothetical protein